MVFSLSDMLALTIHYSEKRGTSKTSAEPPEPMGLEIRVLPRYPEELISKIFA
jgi:hypothetical protein